MNIFTKFKHRKTSKAVKEAGRNSHANNDVIVFPLQPVKDDDNAYYASILDKAVCDGCHNIALLGGYGAGKSSILKSFTSLKSNKKKKDKVYLLSTLYNHYITRENRNPCTRKNSREYSERNPQTNRIWRKNKSTTKTKIQQDEKRTTKSYKVAECEYVHML